jgi:peptidoglycan/xylan/chitin deacetylase (PgdA/CDA1 family)
MRQKKFMDAAQNFSDLKNTYTWKKRWYYQYQKYKTALISMRKHIETTGEYIRFPFYHHIFDDERADFDRQLHYLKNYGEFISIDAAIDLLNRPGKIGGRYFCLTFDDGFKCCLTNGVPILVAHRCAAAFFLPADYINTTFEHDAEKITRFFSKTTYGMSIEFLSWEDCKLLLASGMTVGAHTCSHVKLADLNREQVTQELVNSKKIVEERLGIKCEHFASPWGAPGRHFLVDRDPLIAQEVGYRSFLTTVRGPNIQGTSPFAIKRDFILPGWGVYQLRFFFGE